MPMAIPSPRILLIESNPLAARQVTAIFTGLSVGLDAPVHTRNLCTCLGLAEPSLYLAKYAPTGRTQPFIRPSGGYAAIILAETYFNITAADILEDLKTATYPVPVVLGMAHLPPCVPPMAHAVVERTASRTAPQWDLPSLRDTLLSLVRPFTLA